MRRMVHKGAEREPALGAELGCRSTAEGGLAGVPEPFPQPLDHVQVRLQDSGSDTQGERVLLEGSGMIKIKPVFRNWGALHIAVLILQNTNIGLSYITDMEG